MREALNNITDYLIWILYFLFSRRSLCTSFYLHLLLLTSVHCLVAWLYVYECVCVCARSISCCWFIFACKRVYSAIVLQRETFALATGLEINTNNNNTTKEKWNIPKYAWRRWSRRRRRRRWWWRRVEVLMVWGISQEHANDAACIYFCN